MPLDPPPSDGLFLRFLCYDELVAYYQKAFGCERVCVIPFELLRSDPVAYLERICRFAGVESPKDEISFDVVKPGVPASSVSFRRFMNTFVAHSPANPLTFLTPKQLYWRGFVPAMRLADHFFRPFAADSLLKYEKRLQHMLDDFFVASNLRTSELIGEDLKRFGYRI